MLSFSMESTDIVILSRLFWLPSRESVDVIIVLSPPVLLHSRLSVEASIKSSRSSSRSLTESGSNWVSVLLLATEVTDLILLLRLVVADLTRVGMPDCLGRNTVSSFGSSGRLEQSKLSLLATLSVRESGRTPIISCKDNSSVKGILMSNFSTLASACLIIESISKRRSS